MKFASPPAARAVAAANASLMLAVSLSSCSTFVASRSPHEVVAAELAFARLADEIGVRPAFVASFADDAIWMIPAPTSLRDAHAARPGPADPRAVRLEWAPAIAGVAASGEMGFTTGPSTMSLRDGSAAPRHGAYFSVWKRDADDRWRVALDTGVQSHAAIEPATFQPAPAQHVIRTGLASVETLFERERRTRWDRSAWLAALADDALLMRSDAPFLRSAAVADALAGVLALEPLGGRVAGSGDLGYTYGRWRSDGASGHYVHLWTGDTQGRARIAVVVRLP